MFGACNLLQVSYVSGCMKNAILCEKLELISMLCIYYSYTIVNYSVKLMIDKDTTTIQIKKSVVKELKSIRKYPRETYNETILNLIKSAKQSQKKRQYDEFLHRIQQLKMKELWNNEEDEAWENV